MNATHRTRVIKSVLTATAHSAVSVKLALFSAATAEPVNVCYYKYSLSLQILRITLPIDVHSTSLLVTLS